MAPKLRLYISNPFRFAIGSMRMKRWLSKSLLVSSQARSIFHVNSNNWLLLKLYKFNISKLKITSSKKTTIQNYKYFESKSNDRFSFKYLQLIANQHCIHFWIYLNWTLKIQCKLSVARNHHSPYSIHICASLSLQ